MKTKSLLLLLSVPITITALSYIILSSIITYADDDGVVDQINITIPVSCTMSGTGMTSHNATINNGLYENNIGSTVLHAFCNDNEGFAIYAAGYTGDEIGKTNSNKLVGTSASGNATIETGLATTAGNPDVSNWAMKLTATQDSGDTTGTNAFTIDSAPNVSGGANASFAQYHVVPNEYTKVAHKNSGTDMTDSTGGVKLTTTYAAYISKTQAADTYSGQVIYTLVHPANTSVGNYTINYYSNGGTGTMESEVVLNMQDKTLTANVFTNGTPFIHWCASDTVPGSQYSCSGMVYENNAVVPAYTMSANSVLNLYAIWDAPVSFDDAFASAGKTQLNGYYKIQDASSEICANVTIGQNTEVIDTRDNEVYIIGKLADNNCWMLDNLRLGSASGVNLTPADTNIASNYTLPASITSSGYGRDTTGSYDTAISYIYYKDTITTHYGIGTGKIGTFYNYCAASAGTYCFATNASVDIPNTLEDSPYDVCPSNWRLPTGNGSSGDYDSLRTLTAVDGALSVTLSGYYRLDGDNESIGSKYRYWTSTYGDSGSMYYLETYVSFVSGNRRLSFPIRCVLRSVNE